MLRQEISSKYGEGVITHLYYQACQTSTFVCLKVLFKDMKWVHSYLFLYFILQQKWKFWVILCFNKSKRGSSCQRKHTYKHYKAGHTIGKLGGFNPHSYNSWISSLHIDSFVSLQSDPNLQLESNHVMYQRESGPEENHQSWTWMLINIKTWEKEPIQ